MIVPCIKRVTNRQDQSVEESGSMNDTSMRMAVVVVSSVSAMPSVPRALFFFRCAFAAAAVSAVRVPVVAAAVGVPVVVAAFKARQHRSSVTVRGANGGSKPEQRSKQDPGGKASLSIQSRDSLVEEE